MTRTLAVDIGNTRVKVGLFSGEEIEETTDFPSDEEVPEEIDVFLRRIPRPNRCIISSVVPGLTDIVSQSIRSKIGVQAVRARSFVRDLIRLDVEQPDQVGTDRIINSLAALHYYGPPAIVISLGTATTFEILAPDGGYIGGCIIPGVGVSKDALAQRAALLPHYRWQRTDRLIGKTTLEHLEIGLYRGTKALVQGLIQAYRQEIGENATTIGTGGYSGELAEDGVFDAHEPWLSLRGLNVALKRVDE